MNALVAIYPYKYEGLWVFDDQKVGLRLPDAAELDTKTRLAVEMDGFSVECLMSFLLALGQDADSAQLNRHAS